MENNKLVKIESEDGKSYNMIILNEFEHKKKRYAVLMEMKDCDCGDKCDCNDECDCECDNDCECECDNDCECGDECCCSHDDAMLCILEITKDKDGNEIFKSIDDDKLFDEVASKADEILSC